MSEPTMCGSDRNTCVVTCDWTSVFCLIVGLWGDTCDTQFRFWRWLLLIVGVWLSQGDKLLLKKVWRQRDDWHKLGHFKGTVLQTNERQLLHSWCVRCLFQITCLSLVLTVCPTHTQYDGMSYLRMTVVTLSYEAQVTCSPDHLWMWLLAADLYWMCVHFTCDRKWWSRWQSDKSPEGL